MAYTTSHSGDSQFETYPMWLNQHQQCVIRWLCFACWLSKDTTVPYYSAKGLDSDDVRHARDGLMCSMSHALPRMHAYSSHL